MRRGVVVGAMLALVVAVTGCGRATDRMALAAYEPDEQAAAPSTPDCLEAWNESAPAAFKQELVAGGFVDVQLGMWAAAAAGTDGGPTLPLTGCSWLSRRGAEYRSFSADWNGEGYTWPAERSRSAGPWGDVQEQRFLRSHVVTADGSLRIVEPAERVTADCIAAWNTTPDRATWNRLRRAPYSLAIVAIRVAAATGPEEWGCGFQLAGRGLEVLEVDGTWRRDGLTWGRHGTAGRRLPAPANARVLGDTSLIAAGAVPSPVQPGLTPRLVVGARRVIVSDRASGCPVRRLETDRPSGRLVLPYVATRTRVTWRPEGGRRRLVASVAARHGELVVPLRRGTGVLRVDTRASGRDLVYVVCLTVTEPR